MIQAIQWFCSFNTSVLFNNRKASSALSEGYNKSLYPYSCFLLMSCFYCFRICSLANGYVTCDFLTSAAHKMAKHSFPVEHLYSQTTCKERHIFETQEILWIMSCWQTPITEMHWTALKTLKQSLKCPSDPFLSVWAMIMHHF